MLRFVSAMLSKPHTNFHLLTLFFCLWSSFVSGSLVKPSISMDPDGEVYWGREVRITCSTAAELSEKKTFILQKSSSSFNKSQLSAGHIMTVTISKVNFDHDGSYQCYYKETGSNQTLTSPVSSPLNLKVTVTPPNILLTSGMDLVPGPGEANITRGHSFTITCFFTSECPLGRFSLIFSGSILKNSSTSVNNSVSFAFPVAKFEHQGNYSCVYQATLSGHSVTSAESAPIAVVVKESLLLILLISGGICLLLLFIVLLVCLVKRSKKRRNSMALSNAQRSPRENGGDYEEDYENLQETCIQAKFTKESQEEEDDSNDYENAIPETGSQYGRNGSVSAKSESQEEETDEEDEETTDDDNDYENVTVHFNRPDEDVYIDPLFDRSNDYPEFDLKSQKERMRAKSKSQEVKMDEVDEDTSDDDDDEYVNVTTLSTGF